MTLVTRLMPSTGTGYRPSLSSDGQGGWQATDLEDIYDETYGEMYGGWPVVAGPGAQCKYDPGGGAETDVGDQQRGEVKGRLLLLQGVDIARGDLWVLDDGRRLRVDRVQRPGGRGIVAGGHQVAEVIELQPDVAP